MVHPLGRHHCPLDRSAPFVVVSTPRHAGRRLYSSVCCSSFGQSDAVEWIFFLRSAQILNGVFYTCVEIIFEHFKRTLLIFLFRSSSSSLCDYMITRNTILIQVANTCCGALDVDALATKLLRYASDIARYRLIAFFLALT
jgi:hypothetical protein